MLIRLSENDWLVLTQVERQCLLELVPEQDPIIATLRVLRDLLFEMLRQAIGILFADARVLEPLLLHTFPDLVPSSQVFHHFAFDLGTGGLHRVTVGKGKLRDWLLIHSVVLLLCDGDIALGFDLGDVGFHFQYLVNFIFFILLNIFLYFFCDLLQSLLLRLIVFLLRINLILLVISNLSQVLV